MPDPTSEAACTAAIDLLDVRCVAPEHPHRGSHHRTGVLPDGTRWTVFWRTPGHPPAHDGVQPATAAQPLSDLEADHAPDADRPIPRRTPGRLRRRNDQSRVSAP